ncbi:hypothetical protein C0581_05350 [Candidatus Parcubacteria bacterium]|nr:MAG: hypothetical protein C0581_05350 [Candidatus Parcubacteria bacterium]
MEKQVLVIAGPTGSGESTITKEIIKKFSIFTRLVTATTREPRLNEKDKKDYYFFSEEDFKKEVTRGSIIEHTFVPGRSVYYGTYKPDLDDKLAKGLNIIVNPDVVGARYYKEHYNATTIFIKTESVGVLKDRLVKRDSSISDEELDRRLEAAKYELDNEEDFYDHVVINTEGKLEEAVNEVVEILKRDKYRLS